MTKFLAAVTESRCFLIRLRMSESILPLVVFLGSVRLWDCECQILKLRFQTSDYRRGSWDQPPHRLFGFRNLINRTIEQHFSIHDLVESTLIHRPNFCHTWSCDVIMSPGRLPKKENTPQQATLAALALHISSHHFSYPPMSLLPSKDIIPRKILAFRTITSILAMIQQEQPFKVSNELPRTWNLRIVRNSRYPMLFVTSPSPIKTSPRLLPNMMTIHLRSSLALISPEMRAHLLVCSHHWRWRWQDSGSFSSPKIFIGMTQNLQLGR